MSVLGLLMVSFALAGSSGPTDQAALEYSALVSKMKQISEQISDATFIMHKRELIGDKFIESETSFVKYMAPLSLYMRIGPATKPKQEVLFVDGWNDGRLRVSVGRWIPTINLAPLSKLVMRNNRHSIRFLSPKALVDRISQDVELAKGRGDVRVEDLGVMERLGETAHCYKVALPKDQAPKFYADVVEMCVANRTGLLVTLRAWEQRASGLVLVEDYGYEQMQVNSGLSALDFSIDNDLYNF